LAANCNTLHLFLLLWAALIFIFFWKSNSQLIPYVLPIYPPLAILFGRYLDYALDHPKHWGLRFGIGASVLFSVILIIIGALKLNLSHGTMEVTVALLALSTLLTLLTYWRSTILNTLICLSFTSSLFFISINFSYPPTDTRSTKTLALTLKPLLQKNDLVYSYQNYYQDLPVYLGQRVIMVGYYGELWHGLEHLEYKELWLKENDFWSRWSKSARQFMILSLRDYKTIPKEYRNSLYEIAHNDRNILVSNSPHWKHRE
jgi:4-amino-4-deoxy-L-arabinose transferase-like glycosyltransferase